MECKNIFIFFQYYTVWSLIIIVLCRNFDNEYATWIQKNTFIQTAIGGFYITYINPKKIYIPEINLTIRGFILNVLDALTHYTPALLVNGRPSPRKMSVMDFLIINLPMILYLCLMNPIEKYHVQRRDIYNMLVIYIIFCLLGARTL